jgi:hypothetical protein
MNAWQMYRSLTPEQQAILKSKQVDLNRPVEELMTLLKPLALYDRAADKLRTRLGCSSAVLFVLSFVSLFFLAALPFGWVFVVLLLVAAIVAVVAWSKMRGVDLSNNLRGVTLPMLGVLKEDFDPKESLHLQLDLRPPTDNAKKQRTEPEYKRGAYYKIIDSYFADPWMKGDGVLQDGSRLRWSIVDMIRESKKTKRTARGKIKTKTKYTKKSQIEIEVGLRKKTYDLAVPASWSDEKKNVVWVTRRLRSDTLDPIAPREVIDAIASVFRNARPAQKGAGA